MKMKCPRCKAKLDRIGLLVGEASLCSGCEGLWVDGNNLQAFLKLGEETLDVSDLGVSLRAEDHGINLEEPVHCPYCQQQMRRYQYPGSEVFVDSCTGHGIWLDDGELGAILKGKGKGASASLPARIGHWLSSLFGG